MLFEEVLKIPIENSKNDSTKNDSTRMIAQSGYRAIPTKKLQIIIH